MIQGILQTRNYEDFCILSDTGDILIEFTGAKLANKCFAGDHVKWDETVKQCELELRDEHPLIVGTIELTNKSKYGLTSRGIPIYLFTPYDKRYPHFIIGCSEKDVKQNRIGLIKFDDWTRSSTFPRGLLQQVLGLSGDFEAEKQALIWQACPHKYPKGNWIVKTPETHSRRQINSGITFNIDPNGCKDIDDILTFEEIDDGWRVTITISDVARYVQDGSVEDIFASIISQTLYDNGKVVRPMLPEEYSEKTCSLLPNKTSYGVSLSFIWDNTTIRNIEWFESEVVNNISYTYEEFQELDIPVKYALKNLASYLGGGELTDSHKWIEECMKFYNIEAAKLLKSSGLGLLRRHKTPKLEKLEKYINNCPELTMLAYSSAEYCLSEDANTTHYGLNTETYTHATSPIRRYADLLNQRVLKLLIIKSDEKYIVPQAVYDINWRQKVIKGFERDMTFLKAIQSSSEFNGIIMDIIPEDEKSVKVQIYIKEWKRIISSKYKLASEGVIKSRDETIDIPISEFKEVKIKIAYNTNARNWKERMIINIASPHCV